MAIIKVAFLDKKIAKKYVRVLNSKEKEGAKYKDADGFIWEIKTDMDGNVLVVRNNRFKNAGLDEDSSYFIVREIKGFVDVDKVVCVNVKTELEVNGEVYDVEMGIERDDVTGEYNVVVKSESDEIDGLGFALPEEVGLVLDAIEEPEVLMNVLEQVVMSEGFKNYVLSELGLD
jgi:hypothetical protein